MKAPWSETLSDNQIDAHFQPKGKAFSFINAMLVTYVIKMFKILFSYVCVLEYILMTDTYL